MPTNDITAAERFGCSEEEAMIRKMAIAFSKRPAQAQRLELIQLGLPPGKNAKERRSIYYTHLMQNHDRT